MTAFGKANYEAYREFNHGTSAVTGDPIPVWDKLPVHIQSGWSAGADAVALVLAECPVDEDAPGSEPIGTQGIDRLVKIAEGFEKRHREYADAAKQNAHDQDFARAQTAIGASYRKCAEQLRDVIGDLASPTAEDFDRAAEEIAKPAVRYALVEQMGHRATTGTVREVTFLGEPMLEVTDLLNGHVHLVSPKSLYEVSWLTEAEARQQVKPWTAVALPSADPWRGDDDDTDPDEGKDDGMTASERDQYDRDAEFALDAADEARDLEREAEAEA